MFISAAEIKGFGCFGTVGFKLKLSPGLNLVYGESGVGKSSLLELLNLFGHTPTLPHDVSSSLEDCKLRLSVRLSPVDQEFLAALDTNRAEEGPTVARLRAAIQKARSGELGGVAAKWLSNDAIAQARSAAKSLKDLGEIEVGFRFVAVSNPNQLRMALGNDDALRQAITAVFKSTGMQALVCALLSFSRPERKSGDAGTKPEWYATPRATVLNELADSMENAWPEHAASQPVPGYCAYFHTDMFDLGTGLDVRESPKGHRENWLDMWRGRLQVVDLRGESAARPIRFFADVKQTFDALAGRTEGADSAMRALSQLEHEDFRSGVGEWRIRFGDLAPDALSSGEEQALFLAVWMKSMYATGSILLLDEPELHLSFVAHPAIMEVLYSAATLHANQIIAVTHSPFMLVGHPLLTEEELGLPADLAAKKIALTELRHGDRVLYGIAARQKITQRVQGLIQSLIEDTAVPDAQISFGAFLRHKTAVWRAKLAKLFNRKPLDWRL